MTCRPSNIAKVKTKRFVLRYGYEKRRESLYCCSPLVQALALPLIQDKQRAAHARDTIYIYCVPIQ